MMSICRIRTHLKCLLFWALMTVLICSMQRDVVADVSIKVVLPNTTACHSLTGRLYVFVSQRPSFEPRFGPDFFTPEPFFACDIAKWQPGETVIVDDRTDHFPVPLSELPEGRYRVQAILDHQNDVAHHAFGVGNLFSDVQELSFEKKPPSTWELVLDRDVKPQTLPDRKWIHPVVIESRLLSQFHGRRVNNHAVVILPANYEQECGKCYPVIYYIGGFGSHLEPMALEYADRPPVAQEGETEFIRVLLTGQCQWGHHVYANSANTGPRGDALIGETIPYVDAHYRTIAKSTARFVAGHSSGGWASLWLQVNYPETFGGVWSTSPDPVDFRDWQRVDLYACPAPSLFFDVHGNRRPIIRRGDQVVHWYEDFSKMDDCLGRGGQLRSFEAVFSQRGKNGQPMRLWDRTTGKLDPVAVQQWKKYDINQILKSRWKDRGPLLRGKIHITIGEKDNFYLEGATRLLKETLDQVNAEADVQILADHDHFTFLTSDFFKQQRQQMSAMFFKCHEISNGKEDLSQK